MPSPHVSPNDPCPCGSGKKFKRCCGGVTAQRESKSNRLMVLIGASIMGIAAAAAITVIADFGTDRAPERPAPAPMTTPLQMGGLTPQPPGPAPEGKVWSPEHGHWHDAPADAPTDTPAFTPEQVAAGPPYPQPAGPVPEGKVWSPEHGHWHNDPAAMQTSTSPPTDPVEVVLEPSATTPEKKSPEAL